MPQLDKMEYNRERRESLPDVMRKSVDVYHAAKVLNRCLMGMEPPTLQQERVALALFNKLVPSYAAVMLEVHHEGPQSVHDLNAMLLSAGLDALDHVPEKAIEAEEKS